MKSLFDEEVTEFPTIEVYCVILCDGTTAFFRADDKIDPTRYGTQVLDAWRASLSAEARVRYEHCTHVIARLWMREDDYQNNQKK